MKLNIRTRSIALGAMLLSLAACGEPEPEGRLSDLGVPVAGSTLDIRYWPKEGPLAVCDSIVGIIYRYDDYRWVADDVVLEHTEQQVHHPGAATEHDLDLTGIYHFINTVEPEKLLFLQDAIVLNDTIAKEGLSGDYGMRVGKVLMGGRSMEEISLAEYVCAYTSAAADARMAGSTLPVMSTAGSGNQGITASLPVAAAARKLGANKETMLRAQALSQLITIHIKAHIGKLSPLCGCAIAASIGSSAGIVYLLGGGFTEIIYAIQNMISDISGMICDGAKSSCALKIASSLASAIQCAQLAIAGVSASRHDGIIAENAEASIRNLANLGCSGMATADQVILDMMIAK